MDPNETLRLLDAAARGKLASSVEEYAGYLWTWIARGGFEPRWDLYPEGRRAWLTWVANRG